MRRRHSPRFFPVSESTCKPRFVEVWTRGGILYLSFLRNCRRSAIELRRAQLYPRGGYHQARSGNRFGTTMESPVRTHGQ
jgi:hypothetical protein